MLHNECLCGKGMDGLNTKIGSVQLGLEIAGVPSKEKVVIVYFRQWY